MAKLEHNISRVRKSVDDLQGRYILRTRSLARKMGKAGQKNVRANISRQGGFPGYAITGALAKKVVVSKAVKVGNGWTVTVKVQQTGQQAKYALIHEVGGVIRAKRAEYLTFQVQGRWVRVKQVTIRPKRYFSKGMDTTRREWTLNRLAKEF